MNLSCWKTIKRTNFTNWEKLFDYLELDDHLASEIVKKPRFTLNLPLRLAKKIAKNDLNDPILRQFLPLKEELLETNGFSPDPTEEKNFRRTPRLIQKYQGRALLTATACAMHCRYCFRQNFPYEFEDSFNKELEELRNDSSITEIILSGGDPLSLSNRILKELLFNLDQIPHIQRIRFHSRFPIGIPERIDQELITILKQLQKRIVFVIHANHPREFDHEVIKHLKMLSNCQIPLLHQAVLLKGINDDYTTLFELFELLINNGILPYYLHQLDKVSGTEHFETPQERGEELIAQLAKVLPGYAVPRFVKEEAGKPHKTLILN